MAFSYLPSEILTDILLRLPIKTLSNARFVNKYLLQFISSSDFVTAHLKNSKKNETLTTDCRIILPATTGNGFLLKQLSVDSSSLFDSSSSIDFDLVSIGYPKTGSDSVRWEGSCNVLVCIVSSSKEGWILLWIPCTRKYNKFHPPNAVTEQRSDHLCYGFDYDESSDDYKVVLVCLYSLRIFKGEDNDHSMVHVYNLKSNSWKRIQDFDSDVLQFGNGKLVSGKLHWFTDPRSDKCHQRRIASFDERSEVFGVLELPAAALDDIFIQTKLDVLEGCICMLLGYQGSHADLWIMKEYGVEKSWEKVVTVSYVNVFKEYKYGSPWCVFPNGELLFLTSDSSVVYNPKDGSLKHLYMMSMDRFQPLVYVPSLVSPVGMHLKARFERYSQLKKKLQEDLTDELVVWTRKFKLSDLAIVMSRSIKNTEKVLDSTEKAVGHNLATTGHANTWATEVYSQSLKTSCFRRLPMFSMVCIFMLFVLLIHVT